MKFLKYFLILLCLISFSFSQYSTTETLFCGSQNEKAIELYQFGLKALSYGKIDYAKNAFNKAIETDSTFCDAYIELSQIYKRQNNFEISQYLYFLSLKFHPDHPVLLQNYALGWLIIGEPLRAQENYFKLIESDSLNPEGYYGLGLSFFDLNDYNKSLENVQKAINIYNIKKKNIGNEVYYLLGLNLFYLKKYSESQRMLSRIYDDYKKEPEMNYCLGVTFLRIPDKDEKKAKRYLKKSQKFGYIVPKEILEEIGMDR